MKQLYLYSPNPGQEIIPATFRYSLSGLKLALPLVVTTVAAPPFLPQNGLLWISAVLRTHVLRLGSKCLYPLRHFACPLSFQKNLHMYDRCKHLIM